MNASEIRDGVKNRRWTEEQGARLLTMHERPYYIASIVVLQWGLIDRLKQENETLRHQKDNV